MRLIPRLVCLLTLATGAGAFADTVERRGGVPPLDGTVVRVDDAGVLIRTESGAEHAVAWDRVRRLVSDRPDPALSLYEARSHELWRARSRTERGDHNLAEPIFARWFETYRDQTNETALVVAEGLLRCRLAQGAHAAAVVPALETARLRHAGTTTDSYAMLEPAIDLPTLLCPELAPIFVQDRALDRLVRELAAYEPSDDDAVDIIAIMARIYLDAATRQLDLTSTAEPGIDVPRDHPGLALLADILDCMSSVPNERERARRTMEREHEARPQWAHGWMTVAAGISLLAETGVGRRQRGMVQLLHLPAGADRGQPYLSGLALAWVGAAADRDGDLVTARVVNEELARRYPNHPALLASDPVRLPSLENAS